MSGSCGCENSNCKCAESYSAESKKKITSFQPFMKELPPPTLNGIETTVKIHSENWNLEVNGAKYQGFEDIWWWHFYPITYADGKSYKLKIITDYPEGKLMDKDFDKAYVEGEGDEFYIHGNSDGQDYVYVPKKDVKVAANDWLKTIGFPKSSFIWFHNDITDHKWAYDERHSTLKIGGYWHMSPQVLKEWEDYWTNCKHEDWDIKTMEELNGELLLLLKCLNCGKRAGTSAPLKHDDWDAETFEATVVNKGKVPQGAIAKAMMNRAMITQVSIESVIQELENKVNLGLISEDELMKSLKKKFGAEYDIQVFNSRYGGSDCGKCGGSHSGYCPDYGEEDEYTQCTDCKWDGANGNWNTVIEWCPPCKEENERYWKENAERIRLEKEREEQEERDFIESEKYSREMADIWEDRHFAESNRLSNPGQLQDNEWMD